MPEKPSELLERAADLLDESEIIAVERNNPPDSKCRELWPIPAEHLAALLRESTGYWRLYENRGWPAHELNSRVGAASVAALKLATEIIAAFDVVGSSSVQGEEQT